MIRSAVAAIAAIAAITAVAHAEPVAIIVLPADSAPVDASITDAIVRGARRVSPAVTVGSASLADTAFIAGCDPAVPACLDAVSTQLGVQQLVIVSRRTDGDHTAVEVAATRRGGAPARRSFAIGADGKPSLAELEAAIPSLLGASAGGASWPAVDTGYTQPRRDGPPGRRGRMIAIGGGVLAGVGLALWALAGSTQRDIDDAPTATPGDLEHLADLERTGRTYAGVGNGLVIAGTVAAAAGLGWMLWERRQQRYQARFSVSGPLSAGLLLEGTW